MGELVLAAKVSMCPPCALGGPGEPALRGKPGGGAPRAWRRARERRVSSFVVFDTHWLSNFGYHINANAHHRGPFTSHEAPQMIQDLHYDLPGHTALAEAIAVKPPVPASM